jgi:hypothetical protein
MCVKCDAFATAQSVFIGALGGLPLVDQTVNQEESRPYVVGPSVEVRLPGGFAIEADALYRLLGNTVNFQVEISAGSTIVGPVIPANTNRSRVNGWEFPFTGKYYLRRDSKRRPFAGTGGRCASAISISPSTKPS